MLEIIDKKYINEKYTKMALPTDSCHLIISENEIIYLMPGQLLVKKK